MKDFRKDYPDRMWSEVFYVDTLSKVQGFDTGTKDCLWCPEVGVSASIGYSLFKTFLEAKHKRIENLTAEIHRLQVQKAEAEKAEEGA